MTTGGAGGAPSAKDIRVEPIAAADARRAVERWHYSGKTVQNSQLHLGVFLHGRLLGAMQFGPSLDKRKIQGLVRDTPWNGFLELNRMAFADALPRNSESRALGVAMRLLRRHAPHVQWVVSFADGAQCGDGTIYRASGFVLTGIRRNTSLWASDAGAVVSRTTVTKGTHTAAAGGSASMTAFRAAGFRPIDGFQLRYLYLLDTTARERLTVPVLPFSQIDALGARMYRGRAGERAGSVPSGTPAVQAGGGGASPTPALTAAPGEA